MKENLSIKDLKKTGTETTESVPVKEIAVLKKTPSEEFLSECNEQEAEIFNQLKGILMEQCDKYEFEAVTEDNLEDFSMIITYIKNGVIKLESDGVVVKLRRPLKDPKGNILTESLKILFERNESLETILTKGIKVSKKSIESQKEFTMATLSASFDKIEGKMVSLDATRRIQVNNHKDYMLLLNVYNFFRN